MCVPRVLGCWSGLASFVAADAMAQRRARCVLLVAHFLCGDPLRRGGWRATVPQGGPGIATWYASLDGFVYFIVVRGFFFVDVLLIWLCAGLEPAALNQGAFGLRTSWLHAASPLAAAGAGVQLAQGGLHCGRRLFVCAATVWRRGGFSGQTH